MPRELRIGVALLAAALALAVGLYVTTEGKKGDAGDGPDATQTPSKDARAPGIEMRPADPASEQADRRVLEAAAKVQEDHRAELRAWMEERKDTWNKVPFFNLTQEQLVEMAKNCDVRTDSASSMSPEQAADRGMTPEEHALYEQAREDVAAADRKVLEALYVEAGGKSDPKQMESIDMAFEMFELLPDEPKGDCEIAQERAGLREPPGSDAKLGVRERRFRMQSSQPDRVEAAFAELVGAQRAREIRAAGDGWPGRVRHWNDPDQPKMP